jgi:hypothetical protein
MRSFKLPASVFPNGAARVLNTAPPLGSFFTLVLSILILCGTWSIADAQTVTSRVSGTVKDSAGATVPSAKVTLRDVDTKDEKNTVSGEDGSFIITDVRPGNYAVVVEGTGFKKLQVTDIVVHVDTPVVLTLTLEAGGITETVSVTASDAQSLIRSEDAKLSTTVDVRQVQDLPLNGRNPINLAGGMAGVNTNTNIRQSVINGLRGSFSNITWDGIEINDNLVRTDSLFGVNTPSVAGVSEFTLTTQNAGADDGLGIAQVKLTTPRGGSEYHGSVFDFYRNDKFALPAFGEGGPKFVEKNKLFFYFFYEKTNTTQDFTPNRTVLSTGARTGSFTYLRVDNGQQQTVNLLTLSGRPVDPRIAQLLALTPASNNNDVGDSRNTQGFRFNTPNGSTGRNIGFRLDYDVSQNHRVEVIHSRFYSEVPNDVQLNNIGEQFPGLPGGGQRSYRPRWSFAWQSNIRSNLTNELRFGYSSSTPEFFNAEKFDVGYRLVLPLITNPIQNFLQQGRVPKNYDLMDNATFVKGNHVIRFGTLARFVRILNFNDAGTVPQYTVGFNTTTNTMPVASNTANFPGGISATEYTNATGLLGLLTGAVNQGTQTFNITSRDSGFVKGVGSIRHLDYNTLAFYAGDTWRMKSNLSINLGLRWEYISPVTERDGLGLMPRDTSLAALNDPNVVLDFAGKGTGREFLGKDLNNFAPNFSFAWDPFKSGKTSIRGGFAISYAIDNNATVINNASVGGNAGLSSAVTNNTLSGTVTAGGIVPINPPLFKVPRTLIDQLQLSQQPTVFTTEFNLKTPYAAQWNLGFEREIMKDTALSVGYVGNRGVQLTRGIDTNQVIVFQNGFFQDFLRAQGNLAAVRAENVRRQGLGQPLLPVTAAFNAVVPGSVQLPVFSLLGHPTPANRGGNLANAGIINLLDTGQVGELAATYVGSRCTYLIQNPAMNCAGLFASGPNASQVAPGFFLPANPNAFVTDYIGSSGWSDYHGLQAEVRKRLTGGWYYQVNYTWSKAFTNAEQAQAEFLPYLDLTIGDVLEKKRNNQDVTHVLKANAVYELPFGPGKQWLSSSGLKGKILGGWQISGIGQFRTGRPITFISGRGTVNRAARSGNNTPNTTLTLSELQSMTGLFQSPTTTLPLLIDPKLIGTDGRANTAFFSHPTAGTFGRLSLTPVNGPGYWNVDTALIKRTKFTETLNLELRLEAFNVFNHTNFSVPNSLDINDANFGKINSTFDPRILQLAFKFNF